MPALSPFPAHSPAVCRHWLQPAVPSEPKGTEKSRFPGKLNPAGAESSCAYRTALSRAGEGTPVLPSCPSEGGFCSLAKPRAMGASGHDTGQITEGRSSLV